MSQLSEKERQLMTAVFSNLNGSINSLVNWDQTARVSGYQDAGIAKVMWSRLLKKLTGGAPAAGGAIDIAEQSSSTKPTQTNKKRKAAGTPVDGGSADAADGDDENVGESSTTTPSKVGKKRKAASTPVDGSPAKANRATKKAKGSGDKVHQLNAESKTTAANTSVKGDSREAEVVIGQQAEEDDA